MPREVYIVATDKWYSQQIDEFINLLTESLLIDRVIKVSGCWEIPLRIRHLITGIKSMDLVCLSDVVIIALGAIVKGDTYHFEVLSHSVSDALMRLQLDYGVCIINQILNCYTEEQIAPRLNKDRANYIISLIK